MTSIIAFVIVLASSGADLPWQELNLTIYPDPGISSDVATICRVRVDNRGSRSWSGRRIRFEAEAWSQGVVVERARGRFGLTLAPHESLETLIGFSGRFAEFRVRLVPDSQDTPSSRRRPRAKTSRRQRRGR
jgi:hypothetical protein